MENQKKAAFEWWEFIPHVMAALVVICGLIVFAASFTGLAVLQFKWEQRCVIGIGVVIVAIMLLRWIGQDVRDAKRGK